MAAIPHPASADDSVLSRYTFVVTGAPGNKLNGMAPKGALCVDKTNATLYINKGSKESPTWTLFEAGGGATEVSWDDVTAKPASIAAGATDEEARAAIGAGTSNLAIGTTASTAKAGNYAPTWAQVTSKPAVISAGDTAAEARSAIGAGTSSLEIGTTASTAKAGDYAPTWAQVSGKPTTFNTTSAAVTDATETGREVLTAANAAAARTAIGAGTSNASGAQLMTGSAPTQADSTAADVAEVVTDLNALLANLRDRGVIA